MGAAYFIAGLCDAVCGGGGLITLPALMAVGVSAHFLVGTNLAACIPGAFLVFAQFALKGQVNWRLSLPASLAAMAGTAIGAKINMMMPEETLNSVITVLIPLVGLTMFIKRDFGLEDRSHEFSRAQGIMRGVLIGLVIGTYQGFAGFGAGLFYLLAFCLLGRMDILKGSGCMKVVSALSFVISTATYALAGNVIWERVPLPAVFNIIGCYVGAVLALSRGARFVRPMFFAVFSLLLIRMFV